jgi:DNA-binding transcriptional ArsR family regulator
MNEICAEMISQFERNEAVCAKTLSLLQLISGKVRFRILCLLSRGPFCVQEIAQVVGHGNLSNTSQQLKILRLAGLIERHRDEQKLIYRLADDRVQTLIGFLRNEFLETKQ